LHDPTLVKQLENVLGDEKKISRNTMRNKNDETTEKDIDAVAYLSGTPENITNHVIRDGILSRTSPILVFHTQKEHEQILDYVNVNMGSESKTKENYIPLFYQELLKIQAGENPSIPRIEHYDIPERIRFDISNFIKPLVSSSFIKWGVHAIRELEGTYRFMIAHAFLNIFNRESKDGVLHVIEEDARIAKFLIRREIATKSKILSCINALDLYNIRTIQELRDWVNKQRSQDVNSIGTEATLLMNGLLKKK